MFGNDISKKLLDAASKVLAENAEEKKKEDEVKESEFADKKNERQKVVAGDEELGEEESCDTCSDGTCESCASHKVDEEDAVASPDEPKVPKTDGFVKEGVEPVDLDQQTAERRDANKTPKAAGIAFDGSAQYRLQLMFADGHIEFHPSVDQPALNDMSEIFEYVQNAFADRPDWIEAIENSLLGYR